MSNDSCLRERRRYGGSVVLAQVIEVATAQAEEGDDETNVSGIPLGATVLIKKNAGVRVPWESDCRIVDTQEVLALVEEMAVT